MLSGSQIVYQTMHRGQEACPYLCEIKTFRFC